MKRLWLLLVALLAVGLAPAVVSAQSVTPESLAQYLPANTELFMAMRTDEGVIDEIDSVVGNIVGKLPPSLAASVPPGLGLRASLEQAFPPTMTLADLRQWFGDAVAVGVLDMEASMANGSDGQVYVVVAITSKEAAIAAIDAIIASGTEAEDYSKTEEGEYTIYHNTNFPDTKAAVGSSVMIVSANVPALPDLSGGTLADNPAFSSTRAKLTAPGYSLYLWGSTSAFVKSMSATNSEIPAQLAALGIDPNALNPFAAGFTILDGRSLTIDAVFPNTVNPFAGTLDPAFAANIPANMSFVMHGTNLGAAINTLVDSAIEAAKNEPNPPSREQIAGLVQLVTSLDFEDQLIPLFSGDFALMFDMDAQPMLAAIQTGEEPTLDPHFGVVFEISNAADAATLVTKMGEAMQQQMAQGNNANLVVTTGEVAGAQAVIMEDVPVMSDMDITTDVVIASNASLLVMADRATAEAILSGETGGMNPALTEATQYFLPNTALAVFIDGAGFGDTIALGAGMMMVTSPSSPNNPASEQTAQIMEVLNFGYELFSSSSITLALTDSGDIAARVIVTLK